MGVEKLELCKSPMPDDMAKAFIWSSAVVNKVGPPGANETLWPRKCCESEEGKEKTFQFVSLLKESGTRSPAVKESKAVEEEDKGRVAESRKEVLVSGVERDRA